MGRRKFQRLRLALFANSYCGKRLTKILVARYDKNQSETLKEIFLLAKALNLKQDLLFEIIIKGRYLRRTICSKYFTCPKDNSEIPIFLAVEKEMIEITDNRFMEELLEVEDYTGGILESAIERAVGNKLTNISDDSKFNQKIFELSKIYRSCYYRVAYRYKLPTIRILPFIKRLITLP